MSPGGGFGGQIEGMGSQGKSSHEDYDMMMRDDDLNISGQFSPPHEPEEAGFINRVGEKLGGDSGEANNEIDSPYADLKDPHLM